MKRRTIPNNGEFFGIKKREFIDLNNELDLILQKNSRLKFRMYLILLCLSFSTFINLFQMKEIKWLREPYDYSVVLNHEHEKIIEEQKNVKFRMEINFIRYGIQKHFFDSIQNNLDREYKFLTNSPNSEFARKYFKDEFFVGEETN